MKLGRKITCVALAVVAFMIATSSVYAQKETVLRVMVIAQAYADGFNHAADQIHKALGVKFDYDMSPPQDAFAKAMLEFASQTSSYDIVLFQPANLADFAPHLEPLEPLMKKLNLDFKLDDIMPTFRNLYCSWAGVLYTIPFDGDNFMLFFNKKAFGDSRNKDAFKKAFGYELTPPQTWKQYVDAAKFFNGRDWNFDGKQHWGVSEAMQRGGYAYWWWWTKFVSFGGVPFDENMKPLINSPAGIKALQVSVDIAPYTPPGSGNFGYPEAENAFVKADVAMEFNWSSVGKTAMDPTRSTIMRDADVTVLPGVEKNGKILRRLVLPTGWAAGIPKYSKNKEISLRALQILSNAQNALTICMDPATAVDPWRISSFKSPVWATLWPENPGYGKKFIGVNEQNVKLAVPDLQIPGSDQYIKAADAEISAAIAGSKTVQQAMDDAAAAWEKITDQRGRDDQKQAWIVQLNGMKKAGIAYDPSLAQ
jgi:multiple sugar transport system substrate-binding protein